MDLVHVERASDGYPVCWPLDWDGRFEASSDREAVNCRTCISRLDQKRSPW